MAADDDIAAFLPKPPPPAPARRTAAIDQALHVFDRRGDALGAPGSARPARSPPWWSSLGRPYAGPLVAAASIALIGIPVAWNALSDPTRVSGEMAPGAAADDAAGPLTDAAGAKQADVVLSEPPDSMARGPASEPGDAQALAEAPAAGAPMALAPAAPMEAAPPPFGELADADAAEPALAMSEENDVVVTGTRIARPELQAPNALAVDAPRTTSARAASKAATRGDWNACTVDDPDRSLAGCGTLIDPAAEGAGGRAAAHLADGLGLAWGGDLNGAIRAFDRAIAADPTSAFAYLNRGLAYRRIGSLDRALADLDRAVRFAPRSARALFQRSLLLRQKGEARAADADLERAIALDRRYAALAK